MPTDYYPNLSAASAQPDGEAQLLALLESLQRRTTTGQVISTTYSGSTNLRGFQGSNRVEVEIRRVLYSLSVIDSAKYPDPYASRIRRTRANYTFS